MGFSLLTFALTPQKETTFVKCKLEYCVIIKRILIVLSESIGWIPMWEEYPDEEVEDYMETYGLLVEDLEVMKAAYRQDNMNCKIIYKYLHVIQTGEYEL